MYRCNLCNNVSEAGETQNKIVIKKRPKTYLNILRDNRGSIIKKFTTKGWEIEKEIVVCKKCEENYNDKNRINRTRENGENNS